MNLSMKNLSLVFTAGLFGGLVNCLIVWLFGKLGIPQALEVQIAPPLTTAFIYPELVWGGLWRLLFLIPLGRVLSGQGAAHQPVTQHGSTFLGVSLYSPQRHFWTPIGCVNAFGRVDLYRPLGNSCWSVAEMSAARLA